MSINSATQQLKYTLQPGTFDELGSGIVGLGGDTFSLVSQLGQTMMVSSKFSLCLVPLSGGSNITTKIKFGVDSLVSGADVVCSPMVWKPPDICYYVTLVAISVGDKRLAYNGSQNGNVIIDSGTTYTFLILISFTEVFDSVVEEAVKAERVADPKGLFSICFEGVSGDSINLPVITVHFSNADLKLLAVNTFVKVGEDLRWFTMKPSSGIGLLGNLAHTNFVVGFDVDKRTVFFKTTDCAKGY